MEATVHEQYFSVHILQHNIMGRQVVPLPETYLLVQHKEKDSEMEQDQCTFLSHLKLDEYHRLRDLYWKQVSQIH